MSLEYAPAINVGHDSFELGLSLCGEANVLLHPVDEMVLECPLYQLMQDIGRQQLVDVRAREMMCEWLSGEALAIGYEESIDYDLL